MAAWAGLGYYSRARNLLKAARQVADTHGGRFPDTEDGLRALPGVGPYTAAAVAAIAFDAKASPVDGNIERVVAPPVRRGNAAARRQARPARAGGDADARPAAGRFRASHDGSRRDRLHAEATGLRHLSLGGCLSRPPARHRRHAPRQASETRKAAAHRACLCRRPGRRRRPARNPPAQGAARRMAEVPTSDWSEKAGQARPRPPMPAPWKEIPGSVGHVFTHFRLALTVHRGALPSAALTPSGPAFRARRQAGGRGAADG